MTLRISALTVCLAMAVAGRASAQSRWMDSKLKQPDLPIDEAVRAQVIDSSLAALRRDYVFPAVAAALEAAIHDRVKAHAYDRLTSAITFAETLTRDLQAISHDKHLRVRYSAEPIPDEPPGQHGPSAEDRAQLHDMTHRMNAGFVKVERFDGNIGYLRLDGFMDAEDAGPRAAAAMTLLAETDALILDLRHNHGGVPDTVAMIVSYLYPGDAQIHINDLTGRFARQYWNAASLPGPRFADKPVYVLTSHETFSGGEECAYDLQALKRATVIGEVTGGGANGGGPMKVSDHFLLFVPAGRPVNPVTQSNWEGTGVKPDVAASAAKALDVAYLDALRQQRTTARFKRDAHLREEVDRAIAPLDARR
jgi:hypothetical protein